ncbi:MAG: hypothetical protein ACXVNO_01440 [Bacteroidia bacterium]
MKPAYPIRDTVMIITVTKPLQKLRFQIRHPENVSEIIGIAVTSTLDKEDSTKGNTCGYLTLSLPQKGDVAYSEDVRLDNEDFSDLAEINVWGLVSDIMYSKKNQMYFETSYPVDKAILEGFYEDTYSPIAFNPIGEPKPVLYKIRVYLRYKVKEEADCKCKNP